MMGRAPRGSEQFQVRLPEGMRDRLRVAADENGRSMNAEIVARLDDSFEIPALREELAARGSDLEELREAVAIQRESLNYARGAMNHAEQTYKVQKETIALNERLYRIAASFTSDLLRSARLAAAGETRALDDLIAALRKKPDLFADFEDALSTNIHVEELDGPRPPKE